MGVCVCLRTEWLEKHIEPSRLCGPIESFFEKMGFSSKETFAKDKHHIEVFLSEFGSGLFAVVEVYGDQNRIVVDFLPWGKDERKARMALSFSILTMLGGGILVQQDLKRRELMEKVESQFWAFLDGYILEERA
jgi:hypothetical protein